MVIHTQQNLMGLAITNKLSTAYIHTLYWPKSKEYQYNASTSSLSSLVSIHIALCVCWSAYAHRTHRILQSGKRLPVRFFIWWPPLRGRRNQA